MSFKEVTALRKAGEIDAALEMARTDYALSPDEYSASALFWTLRLACERSIREGDMESALSFFNEMKSVFENMDDDEGIAERVFSKLEAKVSPEYSTIDSLLSTAKSGDSKAAYDYVTRLNCSGFPEKVKDNIAWIVFYYLKSVLEELSVNEFDEIVNKYFSLFTPYASLAHSQILNLAIKYSGLHPDYDLVSFIQKWGLNNFRDEDYVADPSFGGGLSLLERSVRRCFINKSVTLNQVITTFGDVIDEKTISSLLSRSYSSILYKDSAELKDKKRFFADADEYLSRISGVSVCNEYHSRILESVVWEVDDNRTKWFKSFFENWGFGKSLMPADWIGIQKEGKSLPSLAERAMNKYADAIDVAEDDPFRDDYKKLLKEGISKLKDNESVSRRLARLLFDEGNVDDAIELTRNLIKTHPGKFYFWTDLAEFVSDKDRSLCASCLAKALLSTKEEKFVGKVHLALGDILCDMGKEKEALCEIERYRSIYEENGWPTRKYEAMRSRISPGTVATESNLGLYHELELQADSFVYSDVPSHVMTLVEFRFEEKQDGKKRIVFYLYDGNNESYKVNPNLFGLDRKAKLFSCYDVKYLEEAGKKRIVSIKPVEKTEVLSYQQAVVDNVNKSKRVIHVVGKAFQLVIPEEKVYKDVKLGDVLEVAIKKRIKDGQSMLTCIHTRKSSAPCDLIQEFSGKIRIKENEKGPFGFVDDIYINRAFLSDLSDGDEVTGRGVMDRGKLRVLALSKA